MTWQLDKVKESLYLYATVAQSSGKLFAGGGKGLRDEGFD